MISIARTFGRRSPIRPETPPARRSIGERSSRRRPRTADTRCSTCSIRLDAAQLADADALGPAHPGEVVPQQIDDHHVFGAVLFAGQQLGLGRAVGGRIAGARPGALDRPRLDLAVENLQEPFGRSAQDLELARVEVAGKRRRIACRSRR